MKHNASKIFAWILTIAMLVTTFGSDFASIRTFADEGETVVAEESAPAETTVQVDEPAPEPAVEESAPEEPVYVEEVTDTSNEESQEQAPTETPVEEQPTADTPVVAEPVTDVPTEEVTNVTDPTEEASIEASDAATVASTEEDASDAATSAEPVVEEKVSDTITITYKAAEGGYVTKTEETINTDDEEAKIEGSVAIANEDYKFSYWKDSNGDIVSYSSEFIPEEITEDVTFTAVFKKVEVNMPAKSFSASAGRVSVFVDAPEGAFPEGTEMKVSAVYDKNILNTATDAVEGEAQAVAAVDISFYYNDEEIEPKKEINVKLYNESIADADEISVVHIDNDGGANVVGSDVNGSAVEFSSDSFSVYVIVGSSSDDCRLEVRFYNGTTLVDSMLVKKDDNMATVLYDPGVGTLEDGTIFKGWTQTENYTSKTTGLTIEQVRTEVSGMLPPATDGTVVSYYAIIFDGYEISYLDTTGASLGKDYVEVTAKDYGVAVDYTVNMAYTPADDEHDFQGWYVDDTTAANIVGYTADTAYLNNTTIQITGNVIFKVNAPEGHWLIFKENGKGATYVAPKFILSGEPTVEPTVTMSRNGYTFAKNEEAGISGWYTDEACTDGNEFEFGNTIDERTVIYAKWIANTNANYTILIWKQNSSLDGYDFAESYVGNGQVGESIKQVAITTGTTGNLTYATIGGTKYGGVTSVSSGTPTDPFTGFTFVEDIDDKAITPEGDAVVNVYFDRVQYKLKLYVTRTNSSGTGYIGSSAYENGQYNGNWNTSLQYVTSINGTTPSTYDTVGNYRYYYYLITAYYGQSIEDVWPSYDNIGSSTKFVSWILMPSAKAWTGSSNGQNTVKGTIAIMDEQVLGNLTSTDGNYLTARYANNANDWTYYIYLADSNGNFPDEPSQVIKLKSADSTGDKQHSPAIDGYTCDEELTTGTTPDYWGDGSYTKNYYYYPNEYKILFMDGIYENGDGSKNDRSGNKLNQSEDIAYGQSLESYYYEPSLPAGEQGYVFAGWYMDKGCQEEYKFTEHTMPLGGVIVYAKWVQTQYRVFLHPNAGTDPTLDWGDEGQAMNFRVSYGGKVSAPTGRRTGYEFVGWYLDEACTQVFNADAYVLNDTTVSDSYDKTTHFTDPMDKWGNGATTNADTARFWITKEFNLYAKWRQVLEGDNGISVVYSLKDTDENVTGTDTAGIAVDNNKYVDNASATAAAAVKPPEDYQFAYWIMQRWDEATESYVDVEGSVIFPGQSYTIKKDYAHVDNIEYDSNGDITKATYTIQLRAKYKKNGEATPTYIPWFNNDGNEAARVDTDIDINEAVPIQSAPTRAGYTFLGWAKVDMGTTSDAAEKFMLNDENWTQSEYIINTGDTVPTMFLYYKNGAFYSDANYTQVATEVAADEDTPYQALFAVWERTYGKYTVHYIDKTTGEKLADDLVYEEQLLDEEVTVNAKTFEGYTLEPVTHTSETFTLTSDEPEKEITFEYVVRSNLKYTVHYYIKDTTTTVPGLSDKKVTNATYGQKYTEYYEVATGYDVVDDTPQVVSFENTVKDQEIIFYYTIKNYLGYIVHYYEEGTTTKVAEDIEVDNQTFGETVKEEAIDVEGYEALDPKSKEITIAENNDDVIFYYKKRANLEYVVHYYLEGTETSLYPDKEVGTAVYGNNYTEEAVDLRDVGYDTVGDTSKTVSFVDTVEKQEITFYYTKRSDLSYTVNYLEEGTNKVLAKPDVIDGQTFEATVSVSPNSEKDAAIKVNYDRVTDDPVEITIGLTGNVVNFYYTKRTDFQYTVHYFKKDTTQPVANSETRDRKTYLDVVEEEAKTVDGYYVDGASSQTITLTEDKMTIIFYYVERENLSYTVKYLDVEDNTIEVADTKSVANVKFGSTQTEEALEVAGYELDESSEETQSIVITTNAKENVIIFYYKKRANLEYTVHYYEENSVNKVAEDKKVDTAVYKSSITEKAVDVVGYTALDPKEVTFVVDVENEDIIFYYAKRTDLEYTVHYYLEGTTTTVPGLSDKVVDGQTFEAEVTEKPIEVEGYYVVDSSEQTITIKADEKNEIFFYYGKKMSITLQAIGGTTTYNAEEHSVEGFTVKAEDTAGLVGKLTGFFSDLFGLTANAEDVSDEAGNNEFTIDGETYTVAEITSGASGTDAATYPTSFEGTAVIYKGDEDVTDRFSISYETANLVINPRNITFTSGTSSKTYDGSALTNSTVTIGGDGFAGNDSATFTVTGSQTAAGSSNNTFTYVINGKESNYNVTKVEGTLTVTSAGGGGTTPTPTPTPTPIDDTPVPLAATPVAIAAGDVLGANREQTTATPAVLGARRGRTDDTTNTGFRYAIILACAGIASILGALGKGKKKDA